MFSKSWHSSEFAHLASSVFVFWLRDSGANQVQSFIYRRSDFVNRGSWLLRDDQIACSTWFAQHPSQCTKSECDTKHLYVQVSIPVLALQDSVKVASSFALQASSGSSGQWTEGLALPAAAPGSGSILVEAGVGRAPTVRTLAAGLVSAKPSQPQDYRAYWAIGSIISAAALAEYAASGGTTNLTAGDHWFMILK